MLRHLALLFLERPANNAAPTRPAASRLPVTELVDLAARCAVFMGICGLVGLAAVTVLGSAA